MFSGVTTFKHIRVIIYTSRLICDFIVGFNVSLYNTSPIAELEGRPWCSISEGARGGGSGRGRDLNC